MICKHCGSQLLGSVCPSCKTVTTLSYTSHELADLIQIKTVPPKPIPIPTNILSQPDLNNHVIEEKLQSAYNRGFEAGHKRGFVEANNSVQKEAALAVQKRQRFFIILAASCALVLALISSIISGTIRYNNGYENGKNDGYNIGYQKGLLVTPTPSPTTIPTPTYTNTPVPTSTPTAAPTFSQEPLMLLIDPEGEKVRQLQEWLIILGYLAENESDGTFGPKTEKAIKQFQSAHKLEPTGIVDQSLWNLILIDSTALTSSPTESVTFFPTINTVKESYSENDADGNLQIDNQQTTEFPLPIDPYQQEISREPTDTPADSPTSAPTTSDANDEDVSESGDSEVPEQNIQLFDWIGQAIERLSSLWKSHFHHCEN